MAVHVAPTLVGSNVYSNNNVANANLVATPPSGVVEGDLLIVAVTTSSSTVATPSGWTLEGAQLRTGTSWLYLFSKRAAANEGTTTFVATTSHPSHMLTCLAYRNAGNTGDFAGAASGTTNPVTMPTVTPAFDNSVILYVNTAVSTAALPQPSHTWSSPATERTDQANDYSSSGTNARIGISAADVVQATPGSSAAVTVTMSSVTSGTTARVALVIRPVTAVPRLVSRVESGAANATTTQAVIDLPSGIAAGDVIIVGFSWVRGASTATTPTYPSAPWSTCGTVLATSGAVGAWVGWTTYDPSMGTTLTIPFGVSATFGWQATAYAFRNADPSKMLSANTSVPGTSSTTTPTPALPNIPDESYILAFGTIFQTGAAVTSSFTTPLNRDLLANRQGGTSRYAYLSTASDVLVDAGTYPTKNIVWGTANTVRLGVIVAVPPKLASLGAASFFPFFA